MTASGHGGNGNGLPPERAADGAPDSAPYPSLSGVIQWAGPFIGIIAALVPLTDPVSLLRFLQRSIAYAAAALLAIEVIGFFGANKHRLIYVRKGRKHGLRRAHYLRVGLTATVTAISVVFAPGIGVVIADAIGLVVFAAVHRRAYQRMGPSQPLGLRRHLERALSAISSGRLEEISLWPNAIAVKRLGMMLVAWLSTVALLFSAAGSMAVIVSRAVHRHLHASNKHHKLPHKQAASTSQRGSPSSAGGQSPHGEEHATRIWDGECRYLPGHGAPEWARESLRLAIEGPGAPGVPLAGCTGKVHVNNRAACGKFAWTEGENPVSEAKLSLETDCEPLGATVYLPPAVNPVRRLIEDVGEAWSAKRIPAGSGDLYPIETWQGTYLLIRTARGAPTFLKLPPPVASAWWAAVNEVGWLWPREVGEADGVQTFALDQNGEPGREVLRINYYASEHRAVRGRWSYAIGERLAIDTRALEAAASEAKS